MSYLQAVARLGSRLALQTPGRASKSSTPNTEKIWLGESAESVKVTNATKSYKPYACSQNRIKIQAKSKPNPTKIKPNPNQNQIEIEIESKSNQNHDRILI